MKTVKEMIETLQEFPLDAECHAYEGEVSGLVITKGEDQGVIHCSEGVDKRETEYI